MLWLETLSSFGSSFIGHGLPRGCNGAVSTLCLGRYDQVRDSRLHLGLVWVWDLRWLERGRISWGRSALAGAQKSGEINK